MPSGIRVTVEFATPSGCPVAALAQRADTTIRDVTTSIPPGDGTPGTAEFLVDADAVPADYEHDPVFTYTDRHCYRIPHGTDDGCPCACLGEFDTPVDRYTATPGGLRLVFHASGFERLQTVVAELRDRYPDVDIQRLIRAPSQGASRDAVFVDRSRLTDRQREVLRESYDRGYFERPRRANATEIADALGIAPSTFTEHLRAAQRKLLADVLEDDR